jgi:hypothetical protein
VIFLTGIPLAITAARYNIDLDLITRSAGFGYFGSVITPGHTDAGADGKVRQIGDAAQRRDRDDARSPAAALVIFLTGIPLAITAARYNIDLDLITRSAGFGYHTDAGADGKVRQIGDAAQRRDRDDARSPAAEAHA